MDGLAAVPPCKTQYSGYQGEGPLIIFYPFGFFLQGANTTVYPVITEAENAPSESNVADEPLVPFTDSVRIPFYRQSIWIIGERKSSGGGLSEPVRFFFNTHWPGMAAGNSCRQCLNHMISDYMKSRSDVNTLRTSYPFEFCVTTCLPLPSMQSSFWAALLPVYLQNLLVL